MRSKRLREISENEPPRERQPALSWCSLMSIPQIFQADRVCLFRDEPAQFAFESISIADNSDFSVLPDFDEYRPELASDTSLIVGLRVGIQSHGFGNSHFDLIRISNVSAVHTNFKHENRHVQYRTCEQSHEGFERHGAIMQGTRLAMRYSIKRRPTFGTPVISGKRDLVAPHNRVRRRSPATLRTTQPLSQFSKDHQC